MIEPVMEVFVVTDYGRDTPKVLATHARILSIASGRIEAEIGGQLIKFLKHEYRQGKLILDCEFELPMPLDALRKLAQMLNELTPVTKVIYARMSISRELKSQVAEFLRESRLINSLILNASAEVGEADIVSPHIRGDAALSIGLKTANVEKALEILNEFVNEFLKRFALSIL